jgi:hypothetical protein
MTLTTEAVGLRRRFVKTTALATLDLFPSGGRSRPCSARPRTNGLGSTQGVHALPAGRALHAGV